MSLSREHPMPIPTDLSPYAVRYAIEELASGIDHPDDGWVLTVARGQVFRAAECESRLEAVGSRPLTAVRIDPDASGAEWWLSNNNPQRRAHTYTPGT